MSVCMCDLYMFVLVCVTKESSICALYICTFLYGCIHVLVYSMCHTFSIVQLGFTII